jgi:WD40 repeat protein
MGASRRALQDWEGGVKYPTAEALRTLIAALLEVGGLTAGQELAEARELWALARRDAPRMHAPFDQVWFAELLAHRAPPGERGQDWGEAPDDFGFVGRAEELTRLRQWVLEERCRVVAVLGFGGIGKTILAARLARREAVSFERVYWRSLRNALPVDDWLAGAIGFLSDQQIVPPTAESARTAALMQLLRARRCLLVLDNAETLFEPGQHEGRYRAGMDGYGRLLQTVGESPHQSCPMLTSREAPPELAVLASCARALELRGLGTVEARALLVDKQLYGDEPAWGRMVDRYGGNGLALKIVAETIRQVFDGDMDAFLRDATMSHGTVFGGIRRLLEVQAERLSSVEHDVLALLAVEREPVSLAQLESDMPPGVDRSSVVEAIETLRRRSLVERGERGATFTLQSMVLDDVTDRLVESVAEEIEGGDAHRLVEQPLIKAQAKEYVRQMQERLIGAPILGRMNAQRPSAGAEQRLLVLLDGWRNQPAPRQGYGPGNVVNLLRLLRGGDLREMDLSSLSVREVYLAEVEAQDASLTGAHLVDTVLAGSFDYPGSVALSEDGVLLAAGTTTGEVWLWRVADLTPLLALHGHTGAVWGVALSRGRQLLASGGGDGLVRLWEVSTGQQLASLTGHTGAVWNVALSSDGKLLASGGEDGTIRLWETRTAQLAAALQGHPSAIWGLGISGDGQLMVSCGFEGTVRLWDVSNAQPLATFQGHTGAVWGAALSADGRLVASGGEDATIRLWEARTERPLATLRGHTGAVQVVALSADGGVLVSGGFDGMVRVWDTSSGTCLQALRSSRRYERMDITGLSGITAAQRTAIQALGAVDRSGDTRAVTIWS